MLGLLPIITHDIGRLIVKLIILVSDILRTHELWCSPSWF